MEQPPDKIQKRPCCTLRNLALGLVFIGLLWRVVRYLLQFPIWGDEAMLSTNFVWLDYGQLLHRLENVQIAPLLFLWGEKTALFHLGPGMLSMRLVPFLAGVGSLFLYWRLARLMLGPGERMTFTPPASANIDSPVQILWQARCIATSEDEQAVSMTMLGPAKSRK